MREFGQLLELLDSWKETDPNVFLQSSDPAVFVGQTKMAWAGWRGASTKEPFVIAPKPFGWCAIRPVETNDFDPFLSTWTT